MSEKFVFEGKTTTEAIEKGLQELKVKKQEVEIKVLEETQKRSFFSILAPRIVKVEMIRKEMPTKREEVKHQEKQEKQEVEKKEITISKEEITKAKENLEFFLEKFVSQLPSEGTTYLVTIKGNELEAILDGEDLNYLIGYRGDTLNGLQTLFTSIASKKLPNRIRVKVDIYEYREKREKKLQGLAQKMAGTVIRNRKSVTLEPMTAFERKIIHTELQDHPKVTTKSIGEEPYRKVVISLK